MTGFGVGRAGDQKLSVVAEARSVNNRFLDVSLKLPKSLTAYESEAREVIRSHVERGRVSLSVVEEWSNGEVGDVRLDRAKALHYYNLLKELQSITGVTETVTLSHLLSSGDLLVSSEDDDYHRRLWEIARAAIVEALEAMKESSLREGETLGRDLDERLKSIINDFMAIKRLARGQTDEYHSRLRARLGELIDDSRLDRNRLETEFALAADRLDITEELVRLQSHIDLFDTTLKKDGAIGKTLNFVLQEMGREVNTIASKSWLFEISQTAVRMKETLEQIREQVQNLE
jgi:uncharacterized protein (TIGR00255 family)